MNRDRIVLGLVATWATLYGAAPSRLAAQDQWLRWTGAKSDGFGSAVAVLDDLDGDGFADVAIGQPTPMQALLQSGRDGSLLGTLTGSTPEFGQSVAVLGDLDGDGVGEIMVGAQGAVTVYSGRLLTPLLTVAVPPDALHPVALEEIGDLDGDGLPDFAVGSAGTVTRFSGAGGANLGTLVTTDMSPWFGLSLAALGDVDGDGLDDLAVGDPRGGPATTSYAGYHFSWSGGRVFVFSGTGLLLYDLALGRNLYPGLPWCAPETPLFGFSVSALGDLDGDGVQDLLVGAPWSFYCAYGFPYSWSRIGEVLAASGATGATLFQIQRPAPGRDSAGNIVTQFGHRVLGTGDLDGDGTPDFAVGDPYRTQPTGGESALTLYSGVDRRRLYEWTDAPAWPDRLPPVGLSDLAVGDVDANAPPDLVFGIKSAGASVTVYRGNDLYLFARPRALVAGGKLSLDAARGVPFGVHLLFLAMWNGVPTFTLLKSGTFDAGGARSYTIKTPLSSSGTYGLLLLGMVPGGVADSAVETVTIW